MVRQRKSHTRLKKVPAVLAEVGREGLSTEGHPEDGRAPQNLSPTPFMVSPPSPGMERDWRVHSGVL